VASRLDHVDLRAVSAPNPKSDYNTVFYFKKDLRQYKVDLTLSG
jgi:hypothetical protein